MDDHRLCETMKEVNLVGQLLCSVSPYCGGHAHRTADEVFIKLPSTPHRRLTGVNLTDEKHITCSYSQS